MTIRRTTRLTLAMLFLFASSSIAGEKGPWNAIDFGVKADGAADDGPAIQKALNAAAEAGGGEVLLPAGKYRIADSLAVPAGVTLSGVWQAPHHEDQVWGTALFAVGHRGEEDGPALIRLAPNAAVKGMTIYYPEQRLDSIQPYPWAIEGTGMHGSVMDLTLVNAYQGIKFGAPHELHYIRNIFGCVLRRGIFIDGCTDIGRIENVHFNPHYWARANVPALEKIRDINALVPYLNEKVEAFIFGRTDWEYVLNTFAFGFDKCYKFIKTKAGACNGNFLGIGADGGHHALWVEASQHPGLLITNGEFVTFEGEKPTEIITTESFDGVLQLTNCAFWGPAHRNAVIQGKGFVSFHQCNFNAWGKNDDKAESLRIEGGSISISSNNFNLSKPHIFLGPNVMSAVIMGNTFTGEKRIDNQSQGEVEIGLNVSRPAKK
ncbi:MAG: glycosyl hydrolase family 28-related protein [Candidatus Omnitrophota bacterium]